MGQVMPIVCPVCKKDDQIQRVSAIVSAGTQTTTVSGHISPSWTADHPGYTSVDVRHSATLLSRRLLPPDQPKIPNIQVYVEKAPSWFAVVVCGILALIPGAIAIGLAMYSQQDKNPDIPKMALGWGAASLFFLYITVGGVRAILSAPAKKATFEKEHAEDNAKKEAEYKRQMKIWRFEKKVWENELYYCHRDDVVFRQRGVSAKPEELWKVLEPDLLDWGHILNDDV